MLEHVYSNANRWRHLSREVTLNSVVTHPLLQISLLFRIYLLPNLVTFVVLLLVFCVLGAIPRRKCFSEMFHSFKCHLDQAVICYSFHVSRYIVKSIQRHGVVSLLMSDTPTLITPTDFLQSRMSTMWELGFCVCEF